MLYIFTFIVIAGVAFSQYRNGMFTSLTMLFQVLIAGFVAFGFWEPAADMIDELWQESKMSGYEDCIALTLLFVVTVAALRLVTNRVLNKQMLDYYSIAQQIGGPAIGAITGYLLSGFLLCVFQTLPIDENFFGFAPRKTDEPALRSVFPADRVWLGMMRHAGAFPLSGAEERPEAEAIIDRTMTFDRDGTFELRYLRYRRYSQNRPVPMVYQGEFDQELGRKK